MNLIDEQIVIVCLLTNYTAQLQLGKLDSSLYAINVFRTRRKPSMQLSWESYRI